MQLGWIGGTGGRHEGTILLPGQCDFPEQQERLVLRRLLQAEKRYCLDNCRTDGHHILYRHSHQQAAVSDL